MSLLTSFLVGAGEAFKTSADFIILEMSADFVLGNNLVPASNPFPLDTVVNGTMSGWDDVNFEFTMPTDGFYHMEFVVRTAGSDPGGGRRDMNIITDGITTGPGTANQVQALVTGITNIFNVDVNTFFSQGQVIRFGLRQTSGASRTYDDNGTYASIMRSDIVV